MSLHDRVIVVTGAAQGLGAAIATAAADAGATVIGADLTATSPDERVLMRELEVRRARRASSSVRVASASTR